MPPIPFLKYFFVPQTNIHVIDLGHDPIILQVHVIDYPWVTYFFFFLFLILSPRVFGFL